MIRLNLSHGKQGSLMRHKASLRIFLCGLILSSASAVAEDLTVKIEIRTSEQSRHVNHLANFGKILPLSQGKNLRLLAALGSNIFEPARIISLEKEDSSEGAHYGILYTLETRGENSSIPRAFESKRSLAYLTWTGNTEPHLTSAQKSFEFLSKELAVLDLSDSRLRKIYYPIIGTFSRLEYLAFPSGGIDLDDPTMSLPSSLKELILYNTRIDDLGLLKLQGLPALKRLVLDGCWFDGNMVLPRMNPNFTEFGKPVRFGPVRAFGYDGLCSHLRKIELIDCDQRLAVMMLYHVWDKLEEMTLEWGTDFEYGTRIWLPYLAPSKTLNSKLVPSLRLLKLSFGPKHNPEVIREDIEHSLQPDWSLKFEVSGDGSR